MVARQRKVKEIFSSCARIAVQAKLALPMSASAMPLLMKLSVAWTLIVLKLMYA